MIYCEIGSPLPLPQPPILDDGSPEALQARADYEYVYTMVSMRNSGIKIQQHTPEEVAQQRQEDVQLNVEMRGQVNYNAVVTEMLIDTIAYRVSEVTESLAFLASLFLSPEGTIAELLLGMSSNAEDTSMSPEDWEALFEKYLQSTLAGQDLTIADILQRGSLGVNDSNQVVPAISLLLTAVLGDETLTVAEILQLATLYLNEDEEITSILSELTKMPQNIGVNLSIDRDSGAYVWSMED